MKIPKKLRTNAILDNLPHERQLDIMRMLSRGPQNQGCKDIAVRLAADGISVCVCTLRNFRRRFLVRHQRQRERDGLQNQPDEFAALYGPDGAPARKVPSTAVLRNLPPERQAAIIHMLNPGPDNKTYQQVADILNAEGVRASKDTVRSFRLRYLEEDETLHKITQAANQHVADQRAAHPDMTEEELFREGQRKFSELALNTLDSGIWCATQKLNLKRVDQSLVNRRVTIQENKAARDDQAAADSQRKPTAEEQRAKIKAVMGLKRTAANDN